MLSAFILVEDIARNRDDADRSRAIIKTLAALVELVVADIVADATIVTRPDATLAGIDDSAGCTIVTDADLGAALARALPRARRGDALILAPGYAPDAPFAAEIEQLLSGRGTPNLSLLATPETFAQRLVPSLSPTVGLVASRSALMAHAARGGRRLTTLQRALSPRAMRTRAVLV